MKESIILFIKGFFIGLANIIPGVSGGTLAITLGIYDKLINVISHIYKNIKKNILFLLPIILGAVISILSLSHVITYCLDNYVLPTILFFIGAILGGLPMLLREINIKKINVKGLIVFLITLSFVIALTFLSGSSNISLDNLNLVGLFKLFIVGMIAASSMVIPGISGSAVMMTLGYYEPILGTIKNLTDFSSFSHNLLILVPFGIGAVFGILLIAKIIEYLLKKHEVTTYYGIIGFVIASVVAIIIQNFFMNEAFTTTTIQLVFSLILFVIGFYIAYRLGDK